MNNTTRRHPRTLNEAFGPYTSHLVNESASRTDWDGVAIILGCITAVVVAYAWLWGGI